MNDKKRILVVEDERNISDFLKCGLEESGFDVSVAYDGNTAWQIIMNAWPTMPCTCCCST